MIVNTLSGLAGTAAGLATGNLSEAPTLSKGLLVLQMLNVLWYFVYFAPEWIWGASLGKFLVGLRVCRMATTRPPGFWRGLLRSAVFYGVINGGSQIGTALFSIMPTAPTPKAQEQAMWYMAVGSALAMLWPLGIALICSTMRSRNGQRGLHDFAAGTRVISLPRRQQTKGLRGRPSKAPLSRPADLPERIGQFPVKGALRWSAEEGVILAQDPALGREVLIWVRPPLAAPLDAARRDCGRTTRLRWLAGGKLGERTWEAF